MRSPALDTESGPERTAPLVELLAGTDVGVVGGRPVALWLPGAPADGLRFDEATLGALGDLVPPQTVFVIAAERDGRVVVGDHPVSAATLHRTIAARAPGMQPFLLVPGAAGVAEPLAREFDGPVLAAPDGMRLDLDNGLTLDTGLTFFRPSQDGPVPEPFRLHEPGIPDGLPIAASLTAGAREVPTIDAPVTESRPLDGMARSIGVPRAGLPYMSALLAAIGFEMAVRDQTFTEKQQDDLVQRLLANYPYLLGRSTDDNASGLVVPMGSIEILITFDPQRPQRVVRNPAGSYTAPSKQAAPDGSSMAVGTINAAYGTGAHGETYGGQTGATRGKIGFSFGIGGLAPRVLNLIRVGGSIAGTANQSNRSTTAVKDAERGKVEDGRIEADLIAYPEVNVSYKIREQRKNEPVPRWQGLPRHDIPESGKEALLVWVPKPYTEQSPAPTTTVTATGPEVDRRRGTLPSNYYASGLTDIPRLFDETLTVLRRQGLRLPAGSVTREELLQKLWNLNTHLDSAVNGRQIGYQITLHDDQGKKIAMVQVHSRLLNPAAAQQVGAVSDKVHLEDVRTAIDGSSGGHTLTNSTTAALSVEFDLLPNPGIEGLGLNLSAAASYSTTRTDTLSAGRTGLWVLVPRYTGRTAAYNVEFEHHATVSVLGGRRAEPTTPVRGRGLVRMPVKAAFAHGFTVDRATLENPPDGNTMPYRDDAVLDSGRRPQDPQSKDVPLHVQEGKGVGMGLVRVSDEAVSRLRGIVENEVSRFGFLPPDQDDPFARHHWYSHGNRLRRRLDNRDLLRKMISTQGLDSHYDQIHQDGMTFTLRLSSGIAGTDLDVDSVKVTVKARQSATSPPRYHRTTNEYHTVNLAMGMDTTGQSVSRSRKLAAGVSLRGLYTFLRGAAMGVEIQRTVGAADSVGFLNNRPELLEYPGEVDEFTLTSDYEVGFEYKYSGRTGEIVQRPERTGEVGRPPEQTRNRLRKDRRPRQVRLPGQTAVVHLMPLGTAEQRGPVREGRAPDDLLDQGVGYFVDTTGLRELAGRALTDLTGPAGTADADIDTFAGTIGVRAHLREILKGEYTTDRLFDTGLFVDTLGALDISGEMHDVRFSGSSGDKFVKGDIKLALLENRLTDNNSFGIAWDQLDFAFGGGAGTAGLTGEADLNRRWQWNTSTSSGRTGAKELIQLDFNQVYAFTARLDLAVSARQEKHSKPAPIWTKRLVRERLDPRTVMFLLSEPEALKRYADDSVPISDAQLTDALTRWQDGKLTLSGDTVARVLTRWRTDLRTRTTQPAGALDTERAGRLRHANGFADALSRMHRTGSTPVRDADVRRDFNATFTRSTRLEEPRDSSGAVDMSGSQDLLDYAKGAVNLPDGRLIEAMNAWRNGDLTLNGDVVAEILARWMTTVPHLSDGTDDQDELVQLLYDLHSAGALPIRQAATRERFETVLPQERRPLPRPKTPLEHMELPEYLTREDPGGRMLGHSGMQTYRHDDGRTTYQIVKEQIEAVAPGMLAAGAEIWDRRGRVVGRMQGGVDALQAMLAQGRDVGMFEEFLSTNGHSFYLAHPSGWLLTDIVEINISSVLTSAPKVGEFVPNTGIEVYSHGYRSASTSKSKDGSQSLTTKLSAGGTDTYTGSGAGAAKISEGHHRGTTRAETGVTEQTVYDWSGHYLADFGEAMTVKVRRLRMSGRPLNNLLQRKFNRMTWHNRTSEVTVPGRLEIQVPRAIAEAGVIRGPSARRDLAALPKLPGNGFIAGTMIDDALPIAQKMLAQVFKPGAVARMFGAGGPKEESSRSLPILLSRLHLTNHLAEATGGSTYQVAEGLHMPGDADTRADLFLEGGLYDLQVIAPMKEGTGTGRYSKHQSGTTTFAGTDHVRLEGDYQVDGSVGPQLKPSQDQPPYTWNPDQPGSRVTSLNQNSAGTENYRREQHAKEQGPVYMVRLQFRGRLHADKFQHHMFRKPTLKGRFHSDPISGDVYAELFEAEVNELRAKIEQERADARPRTEPWPDMRRAPAFDLAPLLTGAAENHLEAAWAYQHVARQIRTQTGGDRPVVLTADDRTLAMQRYRAALSWAVETMRADFGAARGAVGDDVAEPANRRTYETRLGQLQEWEQGNRAVHPAQRIGPNGQPARTPDLATAMNQDVDAMIRDVQAARDTVNEAIANASARDGRPRPSLQVLPELPPGISVLGQDPVYVARDVAHALDTHVRVDVRQAGGAMRSTWIAPDGGVHSFDPARDRVDEDGNLHVSDERGERPFTADLAYRHGLLSDWHRTDVAAFALDDAELGRLYKDSMARQQTFEQAVAEEIAARRERLETVHPGMSERLRHAYEAHEFWRSELDWRSERRIEVRGTQDAATAGEILDRLLEFARPGELQRPSSHFVRRMGERLDDLTSLERLARSPRVRRAYRTRSPDTTAATIEDELIQARSGAVSLVLSSGRPLVAANQGDTVRWFDTLGRPVGRPAGVTASLDLNLDGEVRNPVDGLSNLRLGQAIFQRLRSSAAALAKRGGTSSSRVPQALLSQDPPRVPMGLTLTDAHLSMQDDGRTVPHAGPGRPLADYAPVFWLMHGAPNNGVTVEDIVGTDWTNALDFLTADRGMSLSQRVEEELSRPDRFVRTRSELPDDLRSGTWVAFDGDTATGAAVALGRGRYRTYVPGAEIRSLSAEELRQEAGAWPTFLIVAPDQHFSLRLPSSQPVSLLRSSSGDAGPDGTSGASDASSIPHLHATAVASLRRSGSAGVRPPSPAAGERSRPDHPRVFLEEPQAEPGHDRAASTRVPETDEREPQRKNAETDDIGLQYSKSSYSKGPFCVEVTVIWR
ncbi:hypothetical protein NE236_10140 [Actinoallomurus purpureus]|uniref:hypothetical protein n=1 Tax=Actinoallomurus purpureus TaxID=478114 RepID=UPI002093DF22|nr:hypothetical protein [Actinoallomurus purpureus]MCO6005344.1 hypothetical protein [Actinoallomurus purpureus]